MRKKMLSILLIALTLTFASCGGKDAKESKDESKKTENTSSAESESAPKETVKNTKLYDWNSLMELPDPIPASCLYPGLCFLLPDILFAPRSL